jgi:divalent metal cation (Fe/Co/Zn/Cd) transporter
MPEAVLDRRLLAQHGKHLEYFTIAWNTLEGLVALIAGAVAGSISLVGFGLDSFIEVLSGSALLWRMSTDADLSRRERNEKLSLRIVGISFLALAAYIAFESITDMLGRKTPEHSLAGIILAVASLIVMPLLSSAKRRVARQLGSRAMNADAKQTEFCSYLSAILLGGLLFNAALGWWWADPTAALIMIPFIAREGYYGIRSEHYCSHCC